MDVLFSRRGAEQSAADENHLETISRRLGVLERRVVWHRRALVISFVVLYQLFLIELFS